MATPTYMVRTASTEFSGGNLAVWSDDPQTWLEDSGTDLNDLEKLEILKVSADYSVGLSDSVILIDASSSNVTVTLPPASTVGNAVYYIKMILDGNTAKVATNGSEEIDGDTDDFEFILHESIMVQSDGSNWWIL